MPSDILRRAALLAVGALSLHELRYLAGYGADSGAVEAAHGHAYLSWAAALAVAALVAAGCAFVFSLLSEFRRLYGPAPRAPHGGFARTWLSYSAALALIYSLQELAEGSLAHGHPVGLEGMVGHAGWSAYVLALAIGAVVALALRAASEAIELVGRPRRAWLPRAGRPAVHAGPVPVFPLPRRGVLALNLAGRAPPASC